jgi:hypothetical protein
MAVGLYIECEGWEMIEARRTDILVTDEGEFRCGDVVRIELGIMPRTYFYTGKITSIETLKFVLDCSKEFESVLREVKYGDVWHIEKIEGEDEP